MLDRMRPQLIRHSDMAEERRHSSAEHTEGNHRNHRSDQRSLDTAQLHPLPQPRVPWAPYGAGVGRWTGDMQIEMGHLCSWRCNGTTGAVLGVDVTVRGEVGDLRAAWVKEIGHGLAFSGSVAEAYLAAFAAGVSARVAITTVASWGSI